MKHLLRHRWTLSIAFVAILAISGCGGKKNDDANTVNAPQTTSTNAPQTTSTNAPQTTSTNDSAPSGATSPSSGTATTKGTLTAEAQRLGVTPQGATACPKNAPVKGEILAKRGNIYRTAKSPGYAKVKPIICFADPATAQKAGFTAPK